MKTENNDKEEKKTVKKKVIKKKEENTKKEKTKKESVKKEPVKEENKKQEKVKKKPSKLKKIFAKEDATTYSFSEVLIVMFFSLGLGAFAAISFVKIFNGGRDYMVLSRDLEKLVDTYTTITDNYYEELDKDLLVESAIDGMLSSVGDTYTNYSNADTTSDFNETVGGVYDGIGCSVYLNKDKQIEVYEIFEEGPADKAGLKIGDVVLEIDGKSYEGKTTEDMSSYVKGSKNKEVKMKILRDGKEKDVTIKKGSVEIPAVTGEVLEHNNKKIGYLQISLFSAVSDTQFKKELKELEEKHIEGLIIDVRDNVGGYLSSVTNISNLLLEKNKVIYQLETKDKVTKKKDKTKAHRTYPIAVLVNKTSASASEILASAIKESYHGFVVGTKTYGKGTVQQTSSLTDGSMIKYTVENWLTPDGNSINKKGVEPTHEVELSDEYKLEPKQENDNQLQKALELVSE